MWFICLIRLSCQSITLVTAARGKKEFRNSCSREDESFWLMILLFIYKIRTKPWKFSFFFLTVTFSKLKTMLSFQHTPCKIFWSFIAHSGKQNIFQYLKWNYPIVIFILPPWHFTPNTTLNKREQKSQTPYEQLVKQTKWKCVYSLL